jgi:2-octaprenyl-6-methoxyphenol hydroxylase
MAKSLKNNTIAVVGAGPAGLTLAGLLARAGLPVCLIDQAHPEDLAKPQADTRTTALSFGTMQLMARLGIDEALKENAAPITKIDVQDGKTPFILRFDEDLVEQVEQDARAMGWIVENPDMRRILWENVRDSQSCSVLAPYRLLSYEANDKDVSLTLQHTQTRETKQINVALVIGADGRMSRVRELAGLDVVALDYKQVANVGLITHDKPHHGLALERFYTDGPFAVLPFTDDKDGRHRSAVVWTRSLNARQQRLVKKRDLSELTLPSDLLQIEIERRISADYGAVSVLGKWDCYPLSLYHSSEMTGNRMALVGDACHAIHPIAGQGLNVGMQDIGLLADLIIAQHKADEDVGSAEMLTHYQTKRRFAVFTMVAATDILTRFFGMKTPPMGLIRPVGLGLVNAISPLKRFFVKRAMGL